MSGDPNPTLLNIVLLTEWACTAGDPSPYTPPEARGLRLMGLVKGHPRLEDGSPAVTSHIVKVDGRYVTTASGTTYRLDGPPRADYLAYLATIGRKYDVENPIKVFYPQWNDVPGHA